jgi:glycosyltransferase involved in cell wall biosynthesis
MPSLAKPIVSIIMPAYNAQLFLREAIDSILSQTFNEYEFLIVDDGSTDDTWAIMQSYAQRESRIILFRQENQGVAASLNFLVQSARGELIARMDADDYCHPDRIRQQVAYMQRHSNVGVLSTARLCVAPNGLTYCYSCPPEKQDDLARLLFRGINPVTHGSVMMRKSVLTSLPEPPYQLNREHEFEDRDLWKKLLSRTTFAALPTPLYFKRQYSGSLTARWSQNEYERQHFDDRGVSAQQAVTKLDIKVARVLKDKTSENIVFNTYINAIALLTNGQYLKAFLHFLKSLQHRDRRYYIKSLLFGLLALLGPLGLFIFRRIMNKPGQYFRY